MLSTELGRLRIVALLEGVSYLILLGIAMPLKYIWEQPEAVSLVGRVHGMLSIVLVLCLLLAHLEYRWKIFFSGTVFVSSLIPFGAFWMDRKLARLSIGGREEGPSSPQSTREDVSSQDE